MSASSNVVPFEDLPTPHPAIRLVCPSCGTEAGCNCGVAPIDRAAYALQQNPEKSDRAIAEEIGVSHTTVQNARKTTGNQLPVKKRVGRDGKTRRMPQKNYTPRAVKVDPNRILFHTVLYVHSCATCGSDLFDYATLDLSNVTTSNAQEWAQMLTEALPILTHLRDRLLARGTA